MTSEHLGRPQSELHRLNIGIVSGSIAAVGALLVATDADSWWEALLMAAGLVVTLLVVNRWTMGRFSRFVLFGLIVTAAVWLVGMFAADATAAFYGFAVMATITIFELPRHRRAVTAGILSFTAAAVAVKVVVAGEDVVDALVQYVFVSLCVAVGGVVLTNLAYAVHGLLEELERTREREAEMAVMRERVRFAGDLHDIQGHTLHVVKLKVALAKKLLHSDLGRLEHELDEVYALVGDTIAQTKELAYAQRRLNLSAELENAKNLFEAADIHVRVERETEVSPRTSELLGQVLRETTTNILRHADAEQVWITLSETGMVISNDGVRQAQAPRLSGLAALRDRLTSQGGELTVEQENGIFRTAATLPPETRGRP